MAGWITPESSEEYLTLWADMPEATDPALALALDVARDACLSYLPANTATGHPVNVATGKTVDPEAEVLPAGWLAAQVLHAQHVTARMRAGNGEGGVDGFVPSTLPLVWEARVLLRPKASPLGGLL